VKAERFRSGSAAFDALGLRLPLLQAPMAGVSTPELAAAVSEAGALGAVALGAGDALAADRTLAALARLTRRPVNANVFVHAPPWRDPVQEAAWLAVLTPRFEAFGASAPSALRCPYRSFLDDPDLLGVLTEHRPAVVSFHFGVPGATQVDALHQAGCLLLATATTLEEGRQLAAAGVDLLVAQGREAGGHHGTFDPETDAAWPLESLVRALLRELDLPVIAAGGLMDGRDLARVRSWGAIAGQFGTAFVCAEESAAAPAHRTALSTPGARTAITAAISGRPARGLCNGWMDVDDGAVPTYPVAYDAGRALAAAAAAAGSDAFSVRWAGTGAGRGRILPAATLLACLEAEWRASA
jgi:nitronate monooxygenase